MRVTRILTIGVVVALAAALGTTLAAVTLYPPSVLPRLYSYVLLTPALLGLLLWSAVKFMETSPRWASRVLMLGAVLFWFWPLVVLAYGYVVWDISEVNLFHPGLKVPVFVPLLAFIGILAYFVYSIEAHIAVAADSPANRKISMALATRLLIGPYVAIIFDLTFVGIIIGQVEAFSSSSAQLAGRAFFAFFTGVFVKVVFDWMNQFGLAILSKVSKEKLAKEKPNPTDDGPG